MSASPYGLPRFAQLLRQLRHAAGLTQDELARAARVGVRTLRDLETGRASRPQRSTVELLAEALKLEPAALTAFLAAARGRDAAGPPPAEPVVLFGRDELVRGLVDLVSRAELVTLTGPAGVGKSALAMAVRHRAAAAFPGGGGGVTVTANTGPIELLESMPVALGCMDLGGLDPARRLLVVDGADRAERAARAAVARLREQAPAVCVLVTSRAELALPGEDVQPVPPLPTPPPEATEAEVFGSPAVELFLDRLRRVRRRPVGLDEAITLASLVRRLGGVPLALEHAAAQGRTLELEQILAREPA